MCVYIDPILDADQLLPEHEVELAGGEADTQEWVARFATMEEEWTEAQPAEEAKEEGFDEDEVRGGDEPSPHAVQAGRFDPDVITALKVDPDFTPDYTPSEPLEVPSIEYASKVQENTANGKAITSTREAVDSLVAFLSELAAAPGLETAALAEFSRERVAEVSHAVNHALAHLAGMAQALGDVDAVQIKFGTLSSAILRISDELADADTLDKLGEQVVTLHSTVSAMGDRFNDDIYEAVKVAMDQIKACFDRLVLVEDELDGGGIPGTVGVTHSASMPHHTVSEGAVITTSSGAAITSLGDLVGRLEALELRAQTAEQRVAKLESELSGKGSHVLDHVSLPTKADVRAMVMKEDPRGHSLAAFVNPVTIFSHDKEYTPSSNWESYVKEIRKKDSFSVSELKLIVASTVRYPVHYVGTASKVEPGTTIECFKTMSTWNDSTSGKRKTIETSLENASSALSTYIEHHLAPGSKLARVANAMMSRTEKWYATINKFFDNDLQALKDQGIPAAKTLVLVSEYVVLIFDKYYRRMQNLVEFADGTARVDWLVESIWVNLSVLEEMEAITKGGDPRHNPTLASAFIRFLTKTAAENSTAKLATSIEKIQKDLSKWDVPEMKKEIGRLQKK